MHNNVLNHLISPIIFSYLMFLLACQTNVVDFRSQTLNFAFVKSKTFMASGRVSPSFSSEINLSIIQKWQNLSRYSCPVGYTKQPHCMHAPIGTNFRQHFGTLSRVEYSRHPQWESRNPMLSILDNSSERVILIKNMAAIS